MNIYSEKNDEVLVELTLLGDENAYRELVVRHEKAVKGTAYKLTDNIYSAEDASQDAFVSAWIKLDKLRDRGKFRSFVCSIARNCAIDITVHYSNAVADISLDLQSYEEQEFNNIELKQSLEKLSEKIRETIELHYFKGFSVAEIAQKLQISEGTVKWRLHEGRKQLRKDYGFMEKDYDENKSLADKVMYQVERLKLWSLKNDKSGFEEEYKAVLKAVETLCDSKEKQRVLADVWLRGYWWIYKKENDELLARIRESALEGSNEDVLNYICERDFNNCSEGEVRINYIKDTQIPFYRDLGLNKVTGYLWFWLGKEYCTLNDFDKGIECYKKALEHLTKEDAYYSCALAAIEVEERRRSLGLFFEDNRCSTSVSAKVLRMIDGKCRFWLNPGYYSGYIPRCFDNLFFYCKFTDSKLFDLDMKVGEKYICSDKTSEFVFESDNESVCTPAGIFENCVVFTVNNEEQKAYFRVVFAPNVGIVEQKLNLWGNMEAWQLAEYNITGGEGYLPLCEGNRWVYANTREQDNGMNVEYTNIYEVNYAENGKYIMAHVGFDYMKSYKDTWYGNSLAYRNNYYCNHNTNESGLNDVSHYLKRAEELAKTKRQKVHTRIAKKAMTRIFDTDPNYTPDCTEVGRWNFFTSDVIEKNGNDIVMDMYSDSDFRFEWKNSGNLGKEGAKLLNIFLIEDLDSYFGKLWSEEWVPGYSFESKTKILSNVDSYLSFKVMEDEEVTVPAGEFENCRRIHFELKDIRDGLDYMNGSYDYWFAPDVGIVRVKQKNCDWVLTEYKGRGEGYFPLEDGLFRRFEPTELGGGFSASVEYTFDKNEENLVLFADHLGLQSRESYYKNN